VIPNISLVPTCTYSTCTYMYMCLQHVSALNPSPPAHPTTHHHQPRLIQPQQPTHSPPHQPTNTPRQRKPRSFKHRVSPRQQTSGHLPRKRTKFWKNLRLVLPSIPRSYYPIVSISAARINLCQRVSTHAPLYPERPARPTRKAPNILGSTRPLFITVVL
jgi:hypothetical protein